ncbi:MAG TPA: NYN domain-containing protein [bacterium]|nr:NYN domain-containing protein [bacterium]
MAQPRIVIDGYNLIHAMPELARLVDSDLERARDGLVSKLAVYRSRRNVRVTVVFDGRGAGGPQTQPPGGVEVVFSRAPQNADAKIKNMLALEKSPKSWTVVTSDNSIIIFARDYRAKTIPSAEFAAQLGPIRRSPSAGRSQPRIDQEAPLSPTEVLEWEEFFRKGRLDKGSKP